MKRRLFLLLLLTKTLLASDLWISILSLPPEPGVKAFGIYAHCPNSQRQARLELYEIVNLNEKVKFAEYVADASISESDLKLVVHEKEKTLLFLSIDRSKSYSIAPFDYRTWVWLEPSVYPLSLHQWTLMSMILNLEYPETEPRPIWHEILSDCAL